jgi:FtsP/CotA-like multicopper oxidase with cupredoxin domain
MLNRREFLYVTGAGTAGLLTGCGGGLLTRVQAAESAVFQPDVELALKATVTESAILPGPPTPVWSFRGQILKGDGGHLFENAGSFLGPTIRVRHGQKLRIHFYNELPEESIIHWHGLHVPADMDGHPRDVIPSGRKFTYEFEVRNRAGTYWYHPHPHARTGPQVYGGLAGLFIVTDEEERSLGLPDGEFDLSLVLQDRSFDASNGLVYLTHHMERMTGFLGNRILVNGQVRYRREVVSRPYRLRILNGSNSRIYNLAWSDGRPLTVIGTDGGLLPSPLRRPNVILGPAERVEVWADFSDMGKGDEITLVSRSLDLGSQGAMPGPRGMRGRMRGGRFLPNGAPFAVAHFEIAHLETSGVRLPERLSADLPEEGNTIANRLAPRRFHIAMNHMRGTINNRVFEMNGVADDEVVNLGTQEVWEFINRGGMPAMPHPMHVHGLQFRVLGRLGSVYDGYMDAGWKDTVLLMPGERVRLMMRFADYNGLFLYHCHNLEHEDMGMMRNYYVRAT